MNKGQGLLIQLDTHGLVLMVVINIDDDSRFEIGSNFTGNYASRESSCVQD